MAIERQPNLLTDKKKNNRMTILETTNYVKRLKGNQMILKR